MHPTVVILGGGYSGIGVAHKLLKHTKPKLPELKVILVSPTTHHFWNIASVRGVVPGELSDDLLFRDIASGFQKYAQCSFEFVLGTATTLDTDTCTVQVATDGKSMAIPFTHLVIATGSSYPARLPFVNIGSHHETLTALHDLQSKVQSARSIIVAGSGATGVETAAELGSAFGRVKQITIVIEGDQPLSGLMPEVRKAAADGLERLGVKLIRGARVATSSLSEEGALVNLSTGETLPADLYLPFFGMRPNTQFVPPQFLDRTGSIKLDKTLRVAGLTNVWAVGDVGNLQQKQLVYAEKQAHHLARNLDGVLTNGEHDIQEMKLDEASQIFVTLGKKRGTGQWLGIQVPSFVVTMSKGKHFFTDKGAGLISGRNIVRSTI